MIERYSRKEIKKIWEDKNKYNIWLKIEIAAAEAMEKLKIIPRGVSKKVKSKAKINVNRILNIENKVKHDVIAFLTSINEKVGKEARFLHQGMTSSDVLDTCFNIQLKQSGEILVKDLNILIKGDVDGSIEALSDSLMNLSNEEVKVNIILKSVGMVSQNDIRLASASKAIVICFNVSSSVLARKLSRELGVDIKHYSIIYEAIEEIRLALEGLLKPDIVEDSVGTAEVRDIFKIPKIGMIAGCHINKGKVIRNSKLRLLRDGEIIYEGHLTSLKRFKDDANEVLEGYECGIGIDNFKEFEVNDIIEVYENREVKRKLK